MYEFNAVKSDWEFLPDYNIWQRAVFPWDGLAAPKFGTAWFKLPPGEHMTAHAHVDRELYFVVDGSGELSNAGESKRVGHGDTVHMASNATHILHNDGDADLVFVAIWWVDEAVA